MSRSNLAKKAVVQSRSLSYSFEEDNQAYLNFIIILQFDRAKSLSQQDPNFQKGFMANTKRYGAIY